ncbi:MAG: ABC transporter ATP-binding protein [Myxococcales bacterium]|nr:ABC transporter ATP-binding protein [Myxococcales bacterium]
MSDAVALRVAGLERAFGSVRALRGVDLQVARGEVLGFLGPNGAGKTTVLRVLAGLLLPTAGQVEILGEPLNPDDARQRARVGYLPEAAPAHPDLDVLEFLHFAGGVAGLGRRARRAAVERVIERCALGDVRRRALRALSKGYRQRVGLAQALLRDPPVLLLDEPTSGLDPNQVLGLRTLVRELGGTHTIVFSSHHLSEVHAVADRVAILHAGRVVADGRPDALARARVRVEIEGADATRLARALEGLPGVRDVRPARAPAARAAVEVHADAADDPRPAVAARVQAEGWRLFALETIRDDLDTVFRAVTGAPPS